MGKNIKRFFEWMKKHPIIVALLSVTSFLIVIPLAINCAYMWGRSLLEPNTAFSANDLLIFYGTVLTFVGTVLLGGLALFQNHRFRIIQKNMTTIQPYARPIAI